MAKTLRPWQTWELHRHKPRASLRLGFFLFGAFVCPLRPLQSGGWLVEVSGHNGYHVTWSIRSQPCDVVTWRSGPVDVHVACGSLPWSQPLQRSARHLISDPVGGISLGLQGLAPFGRFKLGCPPNCKLRPISSTHMPPCI